MLDPKSQHRLGSGVKKMNPVSSFLLATFASNPSGKSRAGYGRGCHRPVARQPRSLLRLRLQCYRHKINALRWSGKKVGWILAIYIERFTVSCLLLTLASFVFWMSKHISWLSLHGAQNHLTMIHGRGHSHRIWFFWGVGALPPSTRLG